MRYYLGLNICQGNYAADTEKINEAKVKSGNWVIKGVILSYWAVENQEKLHQKFDNYY